MTITSRVDASGEPGFDMSVAGGRQARLTWPVSFEVLRVVRNNGREIRKERGDGGRSYGNLVEIRFTDPFTGRKVDVLSAHHDQINPALRVGGRYPAGTMIGNQGRTGSTTGEHFSLDFFDPGTRRASPGTLLVRNRFRDEFERGGTFGGSRMTGGRGASRSSGAGVGRNEGRFLSFLSELESDGRNSAIGYAEAQGGGRAKGRFQFTPITLLDAEQRFGISRRRLLSDDARVQNAAVMEFIRKAHPDAAAAIRAGRFDRAEQLLNRRWTSLLGGGEQARPERRQRALRFLRN